MLVEDLYRDKTDERAMLIERCERTTRRGSILVLVLGVLALMAVFAAVYLTIGVGDQRAARAVEQRQNVENVGPEIGDYLADVIGKDRLAITWLPGADDDGVRQVPYREVTDYPYTDWYRESIPGLSTDNVARSNPEVSRFRPDGSHPRMWPTGDLEDDVRVSDDPYLSTAEPQFLGLPNERRFPNDPSRWWLDNRDWRHISNFAPDGLFVNLYALRNNFEAESGIQNGQMSWWLSLIEKLPGPAGQLRAVAPENDDRFGVPAERNRPVFWTTDQRNLFFPIGQPFLMLDRNGQTAGWGSPDYGPYQYADTDGDGFADARWFELRDSTVLGRTLDLLPSRQDMRYFVAARAIDLSGLVNVNTAMDGLSAPTVEAPLGSSPSEIDLRRLLTMEDFAFDYQALPSMGTGGLSYESIQRPRVEGGISTAPSSDYSRYSLQSVNSAPLSFWAGWYAYDAVLRTIQSDSANLPFGRDMRGDAATLNLAQSQQVLLPTTMLEYGYLLNGENLSLLNSMNLRAGNRRDRYLNATARNPLAAADRPDLAALPSERFGAALFGITDLAELLTYRGLNDPASLSRLEFATGGRLDDGANVNDPFAAAQTTRRFDPLRSGRALAFELLGHDDVRGDNVFAGAPFPGPDGAIDPDALALMVLSPRQRLTTLSGASEIANNNPLPAWYFPGSSEVNGQVQSPAGNRLLDDEYKPSVVSVASDPSASFRIYRQALAPYSNIDDAWGLAGPNFLQYRTLFYGNHGPEFAMRAAAHLAVNLRDQYDEDNTPTVGTLVLTNADAVIDDLDQVIDQNPTRWPGYVSGAKMVVPEEFGNPNPGNNAVVESEVLNVYGIEAQAFIVEAMSINVYTDAPSGSGGDGDFCVQCLCPTPAGSPRTDRRITINGTADWDTNPDLIMQVLAVKLHNPFNETVTFEANRGRRFSHYIEFGGRFFKLGQYRAPDPLAAEPQFEYDSVSIGPGETRTFYVLAQEDEEAIRERWVAHLASYGAVLNPPDVDPVRPWLERQFGANAVWMREFDPRTGFLAGVPCVDGDDEAEVNENVVPEPTHRFQDLWSAPTAPVLRNGDRTVTPDFNVVRLWRKIETTTTDPDNPNNEIVERVNEMMCGDTNSGNWIANDQLVDRLRAPVGFTDGLDSRLGTGNVEVGQTRGCDEILNELAVDGLFHANTGWTIAPHAYLRRTGMSNTSSARESAGGEAIEGSLPMWCLETLSNADNDSANRGRSFGPRGSLSNTDFGAGGEDERTPFDFGFRWAFQRLGEFITAPAINENIEDGQRLPHEWRAVPAFKQNKLKGILYGISTGENQPAPRPVGVETFLNPSLNIRNGYLVVPEFGDQADPRRWIDVSRVTDMLMAHAIGPQFDPLAANDRDNDPTLPGRWLTLGEAFSLALAFDWHDRNAGAPPVQLQGLSGRYTFLDLAIEGIGPGATSAPSAGDPDNQYVFDRGHLWLDKFVPFQDVNTNGVFDPGIDVRLGSGTPLALRVLDAVRSGLARRDGEAETDYQIRLRRTQQRPVAGKVNVNTASLATLRSVGMLSPSLARGANGWPENWVWRLGAEFGAVGGTNNQAFIDWARAELGMPDVSRMDIAATLASYRDRTRQVEYRLASLPVAVQAILASDPGYGFRSSDIDGNDDAQVKQENHRDDSGRAIRTAIGGLRETPGFAHIGELMTARFGINSSPYYQQLAPSQMDYLGKDFPAANETAGFVLKNFRRDQGNESFTVTTDSRLSNRIGNDYGEQLALASQALELMTVRSDYFAVWFVVHGYTREDVSDLGPNDPMTPSFARRYLMVVDRSKVGTWIDSNSDGIEQESEVVSKPDIVLFKEVPL